MRGFTPQRMQACEVCKRTPCVAFDLCGRCYRFQLRNGVLPSATALWENRERKKMDRTQNLKTRVAETATRKCRWCAQLKLKLSQFPKKSIGVFGPICLECLSKPRKPEKEIDRERRIQKRRFIAALKNHPCADCGVRFPPIVMDFDHVRGEKKLSVSLAASRKKEIILEEAKKCDVVCSNCHRIRTAKRKGWSSFLIE